MDKVSVALWNHLKAMHGSQLTHPCSISKIIKQPLKISTSMPLLLLDGVGCLSLGPQAEAEIHFGRQVAYFGSESREQETKRVGIAAGKEGN